MTKISHKPAGPWRHLPGEGEDAEADAEDGEDDEEEEAEEGLEVLLAHARLQVRDEGHDLAQPEHTQGLQRRLSVSVCWKFGTCIQAEYPTFIFQHYSAFNL